jgi:hypothetical protein
MTIVYLTMRREPKIEWFFDSLFKETGFDKTAVKVVVIDAYAAEEERRQHFKTLCPFDNFIHIEPKLNVWNGEGKKTNRECFACGNALNTALCVVDEGEFLVFVADLTILRPGWWARARAAESRGGVTCGHYSKIYHPLVVSGKLTRFLWVIEGEDTRAAINSEGVVRCHGGWLYGPCYAAPLETLLHINGADEATDGMGYEDILMGQRLQNSGVNIYYDPKLSVFEWEEGHYPPINQIFKRSDRKLESGEEINVYMHKWSQTALHSLGTPNLRAVRKQWQETQTWPEPFEAFVWPDGKTLDPTLFEICNQPSQSSSEQQGNPKGLLGRVR